MNSLFVGRQSGLTEYVPKSYSFAPVDDCAQLRFMAVRMLLSTAADVVF